MVSLALNLFVLGGLAGAGVMVLHGRSAPRDAPPAGTLCRASGPSLWALSLRLTPPHRKALQDFLTREGAALAEPIRQLRADRQQVIVALGAETYDPDAAARAEFETLSSGLEIRRHLTRGLTRVLADFTPEERRLLAEPVQKSCIGRPTDARLPPGPSPETMPGAP